MSNEKGKEVVVQEVKDLKQLADRKLKNRIALLEKIMTKKQLAFAQFYIADPNSAEAARKANYSERSARQVGSENLTKPYIQEYVEIFMKIQDDQRIASAKEVLEKVTSIMRGEVKIKTKRTINAPDGVTTTKETRKAAHKDMLYAAKLLGTKYKLWDDKLADMKDAVIHITIDDEDFGGE